MRIQCLQVGPLETNCWVVGETASGPVAVIDPGGDAEDILAAVGPSSVCAVILTHAHFDHLGAVREVLAATGAPLLIHVDDSARLGSDAGHGTGGAPFGFPGLTAPDADRLLRDGDEVELDGRITFEVLHTPGHTEGGICLFVRDPDGGTPHLFSGDTLFAGSVGRSDFPGGDGRALSRSIAMKLVSLPADTVVHPGHGPETTIGREARVNPFWPRT